METYFLVCAYLAYAMQWLVLGLWLKVVFKMKTSSLLGSKKDESLWWWSMFLTILLFGSLSSLAFFIVGLIAMPIIYGLFMTVAAIFRRAPAIQLETIGQTSRDSFSRHSFEPRYRAAELVAWQQIPLEPLEFPEVLIHQ